MSENSIQSFPQDNACWRLDWHGGVRHNPNASDLLIELLLTKLDHFAVEQPSAITRTVSASVGLMPFFKIGTVWINGVCKGFYNYTKNDAIKESSFEMNFSQNNISFVKAGSEISEKRYVIPPYKYKVKKCGMNSECILVKSDSYGEFLIPSIELARFCFMRDTEVSHTLFQKGPGNNGEHLYYPEGTKFENGIWKLKPNENIGSELHPIVGWIAFSREAFRSAKSIYYSILMARRELSKSATKTAVIHPKCYPPFVGDVDMVVKGKQLTQNRYLVLRILSCSYEFPFYPLEIDGDYYHNLSDFNESKGVNPVYKRTDPKISNGRINAPITSYRNPTLNLAPYEIGLDNLQKSFPDLKNKEVIKKGKYKSQSSHRSSDKESDKNIDSLSASQGGYADTNTAKVNIRVSRDQKKAQHNTSSVSVHLDAFHSIIEKIKLEYKVNIQYILCNTVESGSFKESRLIKPSEIAPAFAYTETDVIRRIVMVHLSVKKRHYYLFELERRACSPEKFSTLYLYKEGFKEFDEGWFKGFLELIIETKRWPKEKDLLPIIRDRFNHRGNKKLNIAGALNLKLKTPPTAEKDQKGQSSVVTVAITKNDNNS